MSPTGLNFFYHFLILKPWDWLYWQCHCWFLKAEVCILTRGAGLTEEPRMLYPPTFWSSLKIELWVKGQNCKSKIKKKKKRSLLSKCAQHLGNTSAYPAVLCTVTNLLPPITNCLQNWLYIFRIRHSVSWLEIDWQVAVSQVISRQLTVSSILF